MAQSYHFPTLPNDDGDGFVVIAHRGASHYAPENTHSSFKLAIGMRAEMIELDISLTKDGIPVVIHDNTLNRTTNGKGKVSDFILAELKKLDVGRWFDIKFQGEAFPTLKEVLAYSKNVIAINIEIKTEAVTDKLNDGIEEKSLALVKEAGMENQVIFSSFDYRALRHLHQLAPDMPKALLYEKSQSGNKLPSELVSEYKVDAFNCSYRQLSERWVKDLTGHSIPFLVYTVNDEKGMKKVIKQGATGIFSNKPDVLRQVVENM